MQSFNMHIAVSHARRAFLALLAGAVSLSAFSARVAESESAIELSNDNIKIEFSKNDAFFDIQSITAGEKCLLSEDGINRVPWVLTYKGSQGEYPQLFPSHAVYKGYKCHQKGDTASVTFSWLLTLSYTQNAMVKMTVSLDGDSELLRWNIESGTPKGWVVAKTQFPRIFINRPVSGNFISTAGWGASYPLRSQTYVSSYPSVTGSMQMMMIDSADGAVYYATDDLNACGKDFRAVVTDNNIALITDVINSEDWSNHSSENYILPWNTLVGFSDKGWKDAALRWYRPFTFKTEWGSKTLEDRNIPKWVYDNDMWLRTNYVEENTFDAVRKCIEYFGKGVSLHWYFWHNHPYDTHYPDYFPAKEGFAEHIAEFRSKGSHVVPYINGRLWDPDADSYKARNGASASCRKPDGTLYTEIYPTSKVLNTVTCPATGLWHTVITELVDRIQNELHTDGVYIDQIAAAAPQPCWNTAHGHSAGGGDFWYRGYRKLMDNLRAGHLKTDNIFISEEQAECYIDMFDILLTVNTPHSGCRIIPLFPIVYSGRVLTAAHTYNPRDRVNRGDFQYQNMQCFLYGSQLGWVDPTLIVKDEARYEAAFLRELVNFRKQQHDVFNGGRYLDEVIPGGDNPEIEVHGFGKCRVVNGALWESVDGRKVLYFVNMDRKPHKVTLPDGKLMKIDACKAVRINLN